MTQNELEMFVAGIAARTQAYAADYVAKAIGQIHDRLGTVEHITKGLEDLSARLMAIEAKSAIVPRDGRDGERGERGETGEQGPAGRDADPEALKEYRREIDALRLEVTTLKAATPIAVDVQGIATKAASLIPAPKDGRDAPPVDVEAIVAKAVALIPVPRDGKDGTDAAPVDLDAVAVKAAALIPRPIDGRNGKDAEPIDLDVLAVKAAALVPRPADGRDGRDGKDGIDAPSIADLMPVIQGEVTKAVSAIPLPKDGKDGAQGPKGDTGIGERGPEGPPGRDGRDGKDGVGQQGERGEKGSPGEAGRDGKDGENGQMGPTGPEGQLGPQGEPGRDGANGKDGVDGVGFDDMDLVVDEQRKSLFLRFTRGDVVKEFALPSPLDIGGYSPTETYRKGNGVSEDGSWWVARQDSVKGIKPGDGSPESLKAWRLAVRRGKEGKQGKPGPVGKDLRWEDRDA